jgi:hypothetical protein
VLRAAQYTDKKYEYVYALNMRVWFIDYRCGDGCFWLSAHNCQVPTPTSQNLELEQKIRIFGAG